MVEEGRVGTGTKGLNDMLYGGVPSGNCFILQGPPGNEKDLIANQYIKEGLLHGEAVFAVLSTISPDEFRQQLKFIGINPRKYEKSGDLRIVDWYSYKNERVKSVEEGTGKEKAVIKASFDLTNVGIAITKTIEALSAKKKKRGVINLLSPALNSFGMRTVYNFAQATRAKCRQENITTIFILDSEAHEQKVLSTFHQIFDGLVEVSRTRKGAVLRREIIILSMSGTPIMSEYKDLNVEVNSISVKGVETAKTPSEVKEKPIPTLDDIFKGFLESEEKAEAERASLAQARAEGLDRSEDEPEELGRSGEELPVNIIMFCPECNAEVPTDMNHCPGCGAEFEEEEENVVFQCPNCGAIVKEKDVECPSCGISFDAEIDKEVKAVEGVISNVMSHREVPEDEGDEAEVWDEEPEMELGGGPDDDEVVDPKDELNTMLKSWRGHGYDLSYFYTKIDEDTNGARKEIMIFVSRAKELGALEKRIQRLKAAKLKRALSDLKRDVTSPDKSKRGEIEWSILELRGRVKQVARRKASRMKDKKVIRKRKRS